jgi:hypothetical protein
MQPRNTLVLFVCALAIVSVVVADCPHQRGDLTRWSEWSNKPAGDGTDVTIPAGTKILLDTNTPVMNFLHIEGELIFDEKDVTLDAYFIYVHNGGRLWIGKSYNRSYFIKTEINFYFRNLQSFC